MTCSEEDCAGVVLARGMCNRHYTRWYNRERPPSVRKRRKESLKNGLKTCSKCLRDLPISDYYTANQSSDRVRHLCKVCARVTSYGLTREQYEDMLSKQGGRCGICRTDDPGERDWNVDHDHGCCTGRRVCGKCVRMLLCSSCNYGLGQFKDNPQLLEEAAKYLRNFSERHALFVCNQF